MKVILLPIIVIVAMLASSCSSEKPTSVDQVHLPSALVKKLFPEYAELNKPELRYLPISGDSAYSVIRNGDNEINVYHVGWAPTKVVFRNGSDVFEDSVSYETAHRYMTEAFTFDVNDDGVEDYFVVSFPVGATGMAANVERVLALVSTKGNNWKLWNLSSFFGSDELFMDVDGNGTFEYTQVRPIASDTSEFYSICYFNIGPQGVVPLRGRPVLVTEEGTTAGTSPDDIADKADECTSPSVF